MPLPTTQIHTWTHNEYIITTDPTQIPLSSLNAAFGSSLLHWATALSPEELSVMVTNSVCFGLYDTTSNSPTYPSSSPSNPLVGFGRLITDKTTFAYLTDVYVLPSHSNRGLGTWLIDCVKEYIDTMPKLRQLVLITGRGKKEEYYARKLGTRGIESFTDGVGVFIAKGPAGSFG